MGYVRMPGMLSSDVLKAFAGNVYTMKEEPSPKDEMAATWKECDKEEKKRDKKEDKKWEPKFKNDIDCCCPKKVKFIFVLNNAVVINTNATCEEDQGPA